MRISTTAIEQYIRCPYQFHQERHLKNKGEPGQGMLIGRVVHRTVDELLKNHKNAGIADFLQLSDATDIYAREFSREEGLNDKEKFTVGLQQVHDFIENVGVVNPDAILETEKYFSFQLEDDLEIVGIIDLVMQTEDIDDETGEVSQLIEVVDWKTSLAFTSPSDAHNSLQLSVYIMAAKQLYPEATNVRAALHMLSEGTHMPTGRTDRELAEDYMFIKTIAKRIDNQTEWAPKLNADCIYCHLSRSCDAYKEALSGPMPIVVEDMNDLEALALEREELSIREKIVKKRKDEISDILKAVLKALNTRLELGNYSYKLSLVPRKSYPVLETILLIAKRLGMSEHDVIKRICTVNNSQLTKLIKSKQLSNTQIVGSALANLVETSYSNRLFTSKIKPHKKGKS